MCCTVFDDATAFNKKLNTCEKRIKQLKAATDGMFLSICTKRYYLAPRSYYVRPREPETQELTDGVRPWSDHSVAAAVGCLDSC